MGVITDPANKLIDAKAAVAAASQNLSQVQKNNILLLNNPDPLVAAQARDAISNAKTAAYNAIAQRDVAQQNFNDVVSSNGIVKDVKVTGMVEGSQQKFSATVEQVQASTNSEMAAAVAAEKQRILKETAATAPVPVDNPAGTSVSQPQLQIGGAPAIQGVAFTPAQITAIQARAAIDNSLGRPSSNPDWVLQQANDQKNGVSIAPTTQAAADAAVPVSSVTTDAAAGAAAQAKFTQSLEYYNKTYETKEKAVAVYKEVLLNRNSTPEMIAEAKAAYNKASELHLQAADTAAAATTAELARVQGINAGSAVTTNNPVNDTLVAQGKEIITQGKDPAVIAADASAAEAAAQAKYKQTVDFAAKTFDTKEKAKDLYAEVLGNPNTTPEQIAQAKDAYNKANDLHTKATEDAAAATTAELARVQNTTPVPAVNTTGNADTAANNKPITTGNDPTTLAANAGGSTNKQISELVKTEQTRQDNAATAAEAADVAYTTAYENGASIGQLNILKEQKKAAQAEFKAATADLENAKLQAASEVDDGTIVTGPGGEEMTSGEAAAAQLARNTQQATSLKNRATLQTQDPLAAIDTPAPEPETQATNPSGDPGPNTQVFDDGSSLQTFDDGSTLATATDGTISSSPAPSDTPATTPDPVVNKPVETVDEGAIDTTARDSGASKTDDTSGSVPSSNTPAYGAMPASPAPAQAQWSAAKDLRVKLRVPSAYLTGPAAGPSNIIQKNGGILFPYTPQISLQNQANYAQNTPLHSNYPLYFFKNGQVGPIQVTAKFTVQNEFEGAVLLGVIHLLRALTKMKWGNDPDAGSPPPVCRFDAYGDYMLYNVPVAIASWRHELPDAVDYIAVGRQGSPTTFGHSMVPTMSTITIDLNVMYSRQEMLAYNVKDWLSGGLKYRGYL
jgi:hypothetical protein